MTYEEKFELIVKAIAEAKKYARKDYYPKLYYNEESGLKGVDLNQIHDILLQFQDDDKIIIVKDTPTVLKSGMEQTTEGLNGAKHYFTIDIRDGFNEWYKKRLIKSKSRLQNLDYINLLKIYDVVLDIDQKVQIEASTDIYIPALPTLVRFQTLFPVDSIGTRDTYRTYRHEGLNYLQKEGIISDVEWVDDMYYGNFSLTVNITKFQAFLQEITAEYQKRNKADDKNAKIEIDKSQKPKATITNTKVNYDASKGILNIENKTIKFKKDSFRAKLLELLLKDNESSKKEWSWDEVIEEIEGVKDGESLKENKKKFYPACDGLSKLVAQKTGINDLLIFNKSTVQINPEHF